MPTFQKPSVFHPVRSPAPPRDLTVADMAGVVAEHVRNFLEAPAAYAGLPSPAVAALLGSLEVFTDPGELADSGREEWVFVTPGASPVNAVPQYGLADVGVEIVNSMAPRPLQNGRPLRLAGGVMPSSGLLLVERTVVVAVSAGTRAGAFRAADALYLWLGDMLGVLQPELGCRQASLSPVQVPGDTEKPLFAGAAGNPAVMQITATSLRSNRRSQSNPP